MNTTRVLGITAASLALAGASIMGVSAVASAHDQTFYADCSGGYINLTNYPQHSTITGTIDGVQYGPIDFGPSYYGHVTWDGVTDHSIHIVVTSSDNYPTKTFDKEVTGCAPVATETPTSSATPTQTATASTPPITETPTATPTTPTTTPSPSETPSPTSSPTSPAPTSTGTPSDTPVPSATSSSPVTVPTQSPTNSAPAGTSVASTSVSTLVPTTTPQASSMADTALAMTGSDPHRGLIFGGSLVAAAFGVYGWMMVRRTKKARR